MAQKTLFAIVFIGRQGSSFLEGLLDSHPDARCEGELLSPGGSYFAACGHGDVGRYLKEFLHADPRRAVWASARRRTRAMLRPIVRLGSRPGNRGRS